MKINSLLSFRCILRSVTVLLIILLQLPTASLAFDFGDSLYSDWNISPSVSQSSKPSSLLTTFSNSTSLTITDRATSPPGQPPGVASLYPSPIVVSGLTGTISDVNVNITGITATRPRDLDMLLVAPTGQTLILMGDAGNLCAVSNVNITIDDGAGSQLPNPTNGCPPDPAITSGSYRPTDIIFGTEVDTFPSPAPTSPYGDPAPTGTSTLASVFNGLNPNGTWNLYVVDDSGGGGASTISGGWSLDITTNAVATPTATAVNSNINPASTGQTITFTSTTTAGATPVTTGTVSFTNNGNAIAGCSAVAVNALGNATCSTTLAEGTRTIAANYSGTATLGTSSGTVSQVVNSPTVVAGAQFCNNGGMTVTDGGTSSPIYPSHITVSGLFGTVTGVTAQINGLTAARSDNLDFLLVGAGGQAFKLVSDVGDAVTPISGVNLTLSDAGGTALPQGSAISTGTFKPTDYAVTADTFPAPAPGSINTPAPTGSATFSSVYSTTNPNGTWSLYAVDDGIGGGSSTLSGWCVNFTITPFTTTTTVSSSQNPSLVGQSVTFTATVTSAGGTPTGNVQFMDGATPIGSPVALNGSGQASVVTSSLTAGGHTITAQYAGATVGAGGGGFAAGSGSLSGGQTVNSTGTWVGSASSDWNNPANWSTNFVPGSTLNVDIPSAGVANDPAIISSDVTAANITIGGTHTITIANGRILNATGVVALGAGQVIGLGTLSLGTTATITHGVGGQVNATLQKNFAGTGSFQFPVGTTGQLSPVDVTVTAGSGSLSVRANTGTAPATPPLDSTRMLQRFWTLSGSGITTNVVFHYLDADIPVTSTESSYSIFRIITGGTALRFDPDGTNVILNAAANTFTVNSLSSFSDWTAGNPLAPTAGEVSVSGRILDPAGRGVAGAQVMLQDQEGHITWAISNPFGYYLFTGVRAGATYIASVRHKRYQFESRAITINDNLTDINFSALTSAKSSTAKPGSAEQVPSP